MEQRAAPPLPEVKFTSSRSLEASPTALPPAKVPWVQAPTGPLPKAGSENFPSDFRDTKLPSETNAPKTTRPTLISKFKTVITGTRRNRSFEDSGSTGVRAREAPDSLLDTESHLKLPPPPQITCREALVPSFISGGFGNDMTTPETKKVAIESDTVSSPILDTQNEESASIDSEPTATVHGVVRSPVDVIFHLPEAQVLDSFLHDLINPFVR